MTHHAADPTRVHHQWDAALEPVLSIRSGDTVELELAMAGHGQIEYGRAFEDTTLDSDTLYHLQGPIHVEGAQEGDALAIEVLDLNPGPWGWTGILPGLGLLREFDEQPGLRYLDLKAEHAELTSGVHIPIDPFLGVLGTLPADMDTASAAPPHAGGGNIDTRHLTVGTTLMLPVMRDGAFFSCGDPHAAQGDGEVCVNALETDMAATLRLSVVKRTISTPQFFVPPASVARSAVHEAAGYLGTMGIHGDLMEGSRQAVRGMIELIGQEYGLAPADAYVLCSLAGQLRILEIVDAGVWNVGMTLNRSVFQAG